MTTKFEAPNWKGKTVAVLAGGPSMSVEMAESLRAYVTIAVNYVFTLVPWADALVALDGNTAMWDQASDYAGIKMCGVPSDAIDAMFIGAMYERVEVSPHNIVEIRNSGLAAIRIAARCGASRIVLAGFDPGTKEHMAGYAGRTPADCVDPYPHLAAGLDAVISEVRASGVIVDFAPLPRATPVSKKRVASA